MTTTNGKFSVLFVLLAVSLLLVSFGLGFASIHTWIMGGSFAALMFVGAAFSAFTSGWFFGMSQDS